MASSDVYAADLRRALFALSLARLEWALCWLPDSWSSLALPSPGPSLALPWPCLVPSLALPSTSRSPAPLHCLLPGCPDLLPGCLDLPGKDGRLEDEPRAGPAAAWPRLAPRGVPARSCTSARNRICFRWTPLSNKRGWLAGWLNGWTDANKRAHANRCIIDGNDPEY